MTSLTFYGGVGEIGGNKILLEDKDTRLLLDFGLSFSRYGMYFEEFVRPRGPTCVRDLMSLKILPDIPGIYREDIACGESGESGDGSPVDGVLLTHAHIDHAGCIPYIKKEIPVYCTDVTKCILDCTQSSANASVQNEFIKVKDHINGKRGDHDLRDFRVCESGKKFMAGNIEILPLEVDHSVPGALGFIIYTSEGPVVYTGDYRFHGPKGSSTVEFFRRCSEVKPMLVITEGTKKGYVPKEEDIKDESGVMEKAKKVFSDTEGLLIADFGTKDVDRFLSIYAACLSAGRTLAIEPKAALFLDCLGDKLGSPKPGDDHISIYLPEKERYSSVEKRYIDHESRILPCDIGPHQRDFVYCAGFYDVQELFDIMPSSGSTYLYSHSDPVDEEGAFGDIRRKNWLAHFGINEVKAHASGHATYDETMEAVGSVGTKDTLTIHTTDRMGMKTGLLASGIIVSVKQAY